MITSEYPDNWQQIRHSILSRDNYECVQCKIKDRSYAFIEKPGKWIPVSLIEYNNLKLQGYNCTRVFLQVSHINNIKSDCSPLNLRSLCPPCHLAADIEFKKIKRLTQNQTTQQKTA